MVSLVYELLVGYCIFGRQRHFLRGVALSTSIKSEKEKGKGRRGYWGLNRSTKVYGDGLPLGNLS